MLCPASITSSHISCSRQHASVSINLPRSSGLVATLPLPHHFVPAGRKHPVARYAHSLYRFHLDLLCSFWPSPSYQGISGSFFAPVSLVRRCWRSHCRLYSRSPMRERGERGRTRGSTSPGRAWRYGTYGSDAPQKGEDGKRSPRCLEEARIFGEGRRRGKRFLPAVLGGIRTRDQTVPVVYMKKPLPPVRPSFAASNRGNCERRTKWATAASR